MTRNVDNSENSTSDWGNISNKTKQAAKSFGPKIVSIIKKCKNLAVKVATKASQIFKKSPEETKLELNRKAKKETSSESGRRRVLGFPLPVKKDLPEGARNNLKTATDAFPDMSSKTVENLDIWDRIISDKRSSEAPSFADLMAENDGTDGEGEFYYAASQDWDLLKRQFPLEDETSTAQLLLLEKAAEKGHIGAQIQLGQHYRTKDSKKAERYYKLASEKSFKGAQLLAEHYIQRKDTGKATKNYKNAEKLVLSQLDIELDKLAAAHKEGTYDENNDDIKGHTIDAFGLYRDYNYIAQQLMPLLEGSSKKEHIERRFAYATKMEEIYEGDFLKRLNDEINPNQDQEIP